LSATVTKLAINQLLSQQLFYKIVHYRDANACCRNGAARSTSTFPLCTWRQHLTWQKSRLSY